MLCLRARGLAFRLSDLVSTPGVTSNSEKPQDCIGQDNTYKQHYVQFQGSGASTWCDTRRLRRLLSDQRIVVPEQDPMVSSGTALPGWQTVEYSSSSSAVHTSRGRMGDEETRNPQKRQTKNARRGIRDVMASGDLSRSSAPRSSVKKGTRLAFLPHSHRGAL